MTDCLTASGQNVVSPRKGLLDRMESWRAERDQFDVVHLGRERVGNVGVRRQSSATTSPDGDSINEESSVTH